MSEKKMSTQEKIQAFIDMHAKRVEKKGRSHFDCCSAAPSYGWDVDIWDHKKQIISTLRERDYYVTEETRWGVTDIVIVKPLNLK